MHRIHRVIRFILLSLGLIGIIFLWICCGDLDVIMNLKGPLPSAVTGPPPLGPLANPLLTGARRTPGTAPLEYYATYNPRKDIRFEKFEKAMSGKTAFKVSEFEQHLIRPVQDGFHIERAGEIISLAIGRQLEAMDYTVGLEWRIFEKEGPKPRILFDLLFSISGKVEYTIEHRKGERRYETIASLASDLELSGERTKGPRKTIFRTRIEEKETVPSEVLEGASDRARKAAAAVLDRGVWKLFQDPSLDEALARSAGEL